MDKPLDKIDWWKKNMSTTSGTETAGYTFMNKPSGFPKSIADIWEENNTKRVFESGSQRDNDFNKPLTTNLTPYARLRYGYHMRKNANKYGKGNWELGQPNEALLESADRHLCQYMMGDRSEDHLSAIIFGMVMLMQNEQREGINIDFYFESK